MKNIKKNCQLCEGALQPDLSSKDITEQLYPKEGGKGGREGGSRHEFTSNNFAFTSHKQMVELLTFDLHHVFG